MNKAQKENPVSSKTVLGFLTSDRTFPEAMVLNLDYICSMEQSEII